MKLDRVWIKNFRSIKELKIDFNQKCKILVGLNESGKSNILKALRLLSDEYTSSLEDRRDPLFDEKPTDTSFVYFIFKFDSKEIDQITNDFISKLLFFNENDIIATENDTELTARNFCNKFQEALYAVDVNTGKKNILTWALGKNITVTNKWKAVSIDCPKEYDVSLDGKGEIFLSNYKAINIEDVPLINEDYTEELTIDKVTNIFRETINNIIKENIPDCIFWEYSENNLLPGKIDLDKFSIDPNSCAPLKAMFHLADIDDIQKTIKNEKNRTNGIRNLLNRVAERTTKHIHSIWKEHKDIKIYLSENGTHIDAGVQDKSNIYNFNKRSDGFKRFVTFLILISSKERTAQLVNNLILIDEPDICLHPSGAKYLRDELINISNTNYVIYSTHSIFMIDTNDTSRHYIIKKQNETTNVSCTTTSNIFDEEVLYNAIGYSVFENLRPMNIIFEGWRDKHLFRIALKSSKHKTLINKFSTLGNCHAEGNKDIPRLSSLLDLANRKFIILSDDDKVAIQMQKNYRGEGKWYRYSEILGSGRMTSEDFIKKTYLSSSLSQAISSVTELTGKPIPSLNPEFGRLDIIKGWLVSQNLDKDLMNKILNDFKEIVFSNLSPTNIENIYYNLLTKLDEQENF